GTYLCSGCSSSLCLVTDDDARNDGVVLKTTTSRDSARLLEALERLDGCVHDVDRVRRTERLRQDVVDTGALEYGANRTTSDNTGTGSSRTEQNDTGSGLALNRV